MSSGKKCKLAPLTHWMRLDSQELSLKSSMSFRANFSDKPLCLSKRDCKLISLFLLHGFRLDNAVFLFSWVEIFDSEIGRWYFIRVLNHFPPFHSLSVSRLNIVCWRVLVVAFTGTPLLISSWSEACMFSQVRKSESRSRMFTRKVAKRGQLGMKLREKNN